MDPDKKSSVDVPPAADAAEVPALDYDPNIDAATTVRPPIDYSSVDAFFKSSARRIKSVWTKRFMLSLLAGQVAAICITSTNVTTTELVMRNWALPTTQNIFLYFSLFAVYTPYTMYRYGLGGWARMVFRDGWKYLILAAADVEGNFLVVKAYEYTDLLSCMLLDAWATPVVMFFSYLYMRRGYRWTQILGVLVCIAGLGLLVASDEITNKNWVPTARGKGDAFMIAGATLYGFTNATEEFFVRKRPLYEVVGQLGMWGFIICGAQAAGLEHDGMKTATWNASIAGLIIAYTAAMFILYTVAPLLYRMASSTYYNLSLLGADFYGLIFGLGLYGYSPYWLYFIAFALVLVGLFIYFWAATPEEQGDTDPHAPEYVKKRQAESV